MDNRTNSNPHNEKWICARCGKPFSAHINVDHPCDGFKSENWEEVQARAMQQQAVRAEEQANDVQRAWEKHVAEKARNAKLCRQFGLINTSKKEG